MYWSQKILYHLKLVTDNHKTQEIYNKAVRKDPRLIEEFSITINPSRFAAKQHMKPHLCGNMSLIGF